MPQVQSPSCHATVGAGEPGGHKRNGPDPVYTAQQNIGVSQGLRTAGQAPRKSGSGEWSALPLSSATFSGAVLCTSAAEHPFAVPHRPIGLLGWAVRVTGTVRATGPRGASDPRGPGGDLPKPPNGPCNRGPLLLRLMPSPGAASESEPPGRWSLWIARSSTRARPRAPTSRSTHSPAHGRA